MEAGELVTILLIVPISLTILFAVIGCLCGAYCQRLRSGEGIATNGYFDKRVGRDVESQRTKFSLDVESQRRISCRDVESQDCTSSNYKTVTRSLNYNVSFINENKIPNNCGNRIQSSNRNISHCTITNEEREHHTFRTGIPISRGNTPRAIDTHKEITHQKFGPGITTGRDNHSSGTCQQQNASNKRTASKDAQNQKQAHATYTIPVAHGTRNVEQFTTEPKIESDTSTGYAKLDLHNCTKKRAMAIFKNFLHDSITDYINSNYRRNKRFILVITGRGLHSTGGIPVIKPAVESYLEKHDYTYNWSNPGMARIDLKSFKKLYEDVDDC